MTKLKRTAKGQGATTAKPAAVIRQAVTTPGRTKKVISDTHGIEFLAVGVSKKGGKFLLVAKDGQHAVLSVRNLARDPSAELERLEALDVHLLVPQARGFLRLAQEAARMEPTFKVATQIGWFDDLFVLPDCVFPPQPPRLSGCRRGGRGSWSISTPRTRTFIPAFVASARRTSRGRSFGCAAAIPA